MFQCRAKAGGRERRRRRRRRSKRRKGYIKERDGPCGWMYDKRPAQGKKKRGRTTGVEEGQLNRLRPVLMEKPVRLLRQLHHLKGDSPRWCRPPHHHHHHHHYHHHRQSHHHDHHHHHQLHCSPRPPVPPRPGVPQGAARSASPTPLCGSARPWPAAPSPPPPPRPTCAASPPPRSGPAPS
ncbi:hypothetical protein VTK73DRAFT_5055 [Phialemonium thermophilum]|uniref:Uncharacterized protein n=1 Tax=Phialemonium thermophilum TaxID=223376 RepID=A0ABR3V4C7_9PEZI